MAYIHASVEHCHHCDTYQTFEWDIELIGRQIIRCPLCNHAHLRVIQRDERVRIAVAPKISFRVSDDTVKPEDIAFTTVAGISANSRFGSANHLTEAELTRLEDEINEERRANAHREKIERSSKRHGFDTEAARNYFRGF